MATPDEIMALRKKVDEPDATFYSDEQLDAIITQADGNLDAAAASIWEEKAGRLAVLTDVSESGSSRSNSKLYTAALRMAEHYTKKTMPDAEETAQRPRTRTAVRK